MITNEEYVDYLHEYCGHAFVFSKSIVEQIEHKLWISDFSREKVLHSLIVGYINRHVLNYNEAQTYNYLTHIVGESLAPYFKYLINYTINKQKESEMKEKEFVLTEDVSLYQFRDMPNAEILEIVIPKTEEGRNCSEYPCRVVYRNKGGGVTYHLTTLDGYSNASKCEAKMDIILKPKKRPFTHEEILGLIWDGAIFRRKMWYNSDFSFIAAFTRGNYLLCNAYYSYETLVEEFLYSLDDGKTWHKLEKEV